MINLSTLKISLDMLSLVGEIDEFKGAWSSLSQIAPERLNLLQQISIIENAGASGRHEGGVLNDQQVLMLLNQNNLQRFQTDEERFVAGYAQLQDNIFRNSDHLDFSRSTILQCYKELYQFSDTGRFLAGATNGHPAVLQDEADMSRIAVTQGNDATTSPMAELEHLVSWTNEAISKKKPHPLVVACVFHIKFLAIKPFTAGNGTMAKILMQFLLLKTGYRQFPFCPFDAQIENSEEVYNRAIGQTIESFGSADTNWQPAINILLRIIQKHKQKLEGKLEREKTNLNRLPDLSLQLLELVRMKGRITISEASMLTRANPSKIRKNLDTLVSGHQLQKHGTTKGVWYSMNV